MCNLCVFFSHFPPFVLSPFSFAVPFFSWGRETIVRNRWRTCGNAPFNSCVRNPCWTLPWLTLLLLMAVCFLFCLFLFVLFFVYFFFWAPFFRPWVSILPHSRIFFFLFLSFPLFPFFLFPLRNFSDLFVVLRIVCCVFRIQYVCSCDVFLSRFSWPQSVYIFSPGWRVSTDTGCCWVSVGRNNGLMWRTHTEVIIVCNNHGSEDCYECITYKYYTKCHQYQGVAKVIEPVIMRQGRRTEATDRVLRL